MTKKRAAALDCGACKNRNGIVLANEAFRRSQELRRRHFNRMIRQFQSVHHLHTNPPQFYKTPSIASLLSDPIPFWLLQRRRGFIGKKRRRSTLGSEKVRESEGKLGVWVVRKACCG